MPADVLDFQFDKPVVVTFTQGDCWLLAQSLLEGVAGFRVPRGLKIVTVSHTKIHSEWHHAAIRLPTGEVVDIEGIWTEQAWFERWSKDLDEWWCADGYGWEVVTWTRTAFKMNTRYNRRIFHDYRLGEYARLVLERIREWQSG